MQTFSDEQKLQALQSILLSDNTPKDIDCKEWGNYNNSYRLFYIAVYTEQFEHLGISKYIECFVIINLENSKTVYIDCQNNFFGYSDRTKTYIDSPFGVYRSELEELNDKWFGKYDGKRCDSEELIEMFNDYNILTTKDNAFYEIESGKQIPELG